MTQPQPPQMPMIPFDATPVEQRGSVDDGLGADGKTKLITIAVLSPMNTTVLALTHESARALADQLFTSANGLQIVRDIPGGGT